METVRASRMVWGRDLRYALVLALADGWGVGGAAQVERTVAELIQALGSAGFEVPGRPSKTVSDALRWEVARGRVVRTGRGRYRAGRVARSTHSRMRHRVRTLQAGLA